MSQIECAITDFDGLLTTTPLFDKHDVTLLTRLGLKSPDLDPSVLTSLGQVTLRHNVVVSVSAVRTPAIFFTFHFHFVDIERHYKAETGSGDFRTYWRMAKRFAKEKRDRNQPLFQITELTP